MTVFDRVKKLAEKQGISIVELERKTKLWKKFTIFLEEKNS